MTFNYDFKEARNVRLSYRCHLSNRQIVSSMYKYATENNLLVIVRTFMYFVVVIIIVAVMFSILLSCFSIFCLFFFEIVVIVDVVLHLFIFIWNILLNIYVTETVRFNGLYMVLVSCGKLRL